QNTWQPYDGSLMVYADHQRDDYINLIELYRYDTVLDSIMVFTEPCLTQGQITLFPNPAHSMVYVRVPVTSSTSPGSLTLYDLRGQLVLTKPVINETTGIDVSGLNPGLYFVRFNDNRVTVVLKFVKD
ncbi:MAG TPA: T9SS type A sorting domain-containing protein, partial [Bacteroidales bacterium]|nr:T9SS type A sorting domain-containing protein [Bacteroidales bacterium]